MPSCQPHSDFVAQLLPQPLTSATLSLRAWHYAYMPRGRTTSHSNSASAFRAASSSASRAATLAACWERASSISSSIGAERSSCSSFAARETAAAATARFLALYVVPCFSSAFHSPSAVPVTVRVSSNVLGFLAVGFLAGAFWASPQRTLRPRALLRQVHLRPSERPDPACRNRRTALRVRGYLRT